MKTRLMTAAVLASLAILLVGAAPPQSTDDEIAQLRLELAKMGLRIDRLEHAEGQTPSSDGSGATGSGATGSAAPARTMVLVSINKSDHGADHAQEIARLKRETSALMDTVNSAADQKAYDYGTQIYTAHVRGGVRGWNGGASGGVSTTNAGAVGRRVLADQAVENRYATMHSIKQQKLEALQRADSETLQIICGHDGQTIVMLETKRNLTSSLNNIDIGATVTWTGSRVSADDGSESWKIESIKKVQ